MCSLVRAPQCTFYSAPTLPRMPPRIRYKNSIIFQSTYTITILVIYSPQSSILIIILYAQIILLSLIINPPTNPKLRYLYTLSGRRTYLIYILARNINKLLVADSIFNDYTEEIVNINSYSI